MIYTGYSIPSLIALVDAHMERLWNAEIEEAMSQAEANPLNSEGVLYVLLRNHNLLTTMRRSWPS